MQNIIPKKRDQFEKEAWDKKNTPRLVCGIDEVGRGPLAGPVTVCAALFLPQNNNLKYISQAPVAITDSKMLSEKKRAILGQWLKKHTLSAFVSRTPEEIDQENIYQATRQAMHEALRLLVYKLQTQTRYQAEDIMHVLVDAMPLDREIIKKIAPESSLYYFNKGEQYSRSIAAASILAKEHRDSYMQKLTPCFPAYHFEKNKGYGSAHHRMTVREKGATFIHRVSFLKTIREDARGRTNKPSFKQTSCI